MQRTADLVLDVLLLSTSTTLEYLLQGLRVAENTDNSSVWLTSAPYFVIIIIIILVWIISIVSTFFLKIKDIF